MFPHDEDAKRLAQQTFTLAEFLQHKVPDYRPPSLERTAVVHGHCHQKAIMKMESERALYKKMGLDGELLDSGCCGMAGSFGFKAEHYDLSRRVGELVLLPAVTQAPQETLIIADGFSCREQIAQSTDRQALHTAEVLRMALRDGPSGPATGAPETSLVQQRRRGVARSQQRALVGLLLATGVTLVAGRFLRRQVRHRR